MKNICTTKIFFSDEATAGPPSRMPDGVKPLCGYVHHEDAEKWMVIKHLFEDNKDRLLFNHYFYKLL